MRVDGVNCIEWKKAVVHQIELCPGFVLWLSLWLLSGWHLSKELTIWLLRWGGEVWVISGKNILQTDFQGKQILARKYLKKKIPTLTKISFKVCKAGKKCCTSVFQEKNSITRGQIIRTPLKSQMVGPLSVRYVQLWSVISGNSVLAQFNVWSLIFSKNIARFLSERPSIFSWVSETDVSANWQVNTQPGSISSASFLPRWS